MLVGGCCFMLVASWCWLSTIILQFFFSWGHLSLAIGFKAGLRDSVQAAAPDSITGAALMKGWEFTGNYPPENQQKWWFNGHTIGIYIYIRLFRCIQVWLLCNQVSRFPIACQYLSILSHHFLSQPPVIAHFLWFKVRRSPALDFTWCNLPALGEERLNLEWYDKGCLKLKGSLCTPKKSLKPKELLLTQALALGTWDQSQNHIPFVFFCYLARCWADATPIYSQSLVPSGSTHSSGRAKSWFANSLPQCFDPTGCKIHRARNWGPFETQPMSKL